MSDARSPICAITTKLWRGLRAKERCTTPHRLTPAIVSCGGSDRFGLAEEGWVVGSRGRAIDPAGDPVSAHRAARPGKIAGGAGGRRVPGTLWMVC